MSQDNNKMHSLAPTEVHGHRRHKSAGPIPREFNENNLPLKLGEFKSESSLDTNHNKSLLMSRRVAAQKLEPLKVYPSRSDEMSSTLTPLAPTFELPFSGRTSRTVDLEFNNLSYSVQTGFFKKRLRKILQGISGEMRSGELTAIMGPSGAGKSTLMDILAGYITSWTGSIQTNGEERDARRFRRQSCYIMQDDHLQPLLTVQEAMTTAANLKLGSEYSHKQKQLRVKQILDALALYNSRKTRTGMLSGGQRKRLAIALELVNNPPVMFFDEPTSGLDSSTSKQCIALLKKLAQEGKTVICTIHQPSALILEMFDHMYVLTDGRCVYQGSVPNLIPYLSDLGLLCPPYHNPADFFLEVSTGDYGPFVNSLVIKAENGVSDKWRKQKKTNTAQIKSIYHIENLMSNGLITPVRAPIVPMTPYITSGSSNPAKKLLKRSPIINPSSYCKDDSYPTSFLTQVIVLMIRNTKMLTRDRVLTYMRFFIHMSISIFMGILYFQIGKDSKYTLDNLNFVFFSIMFLMFTAFNSMMLTFPLELPIITREHFNRWYSLKAYYVSISLCDAPIQFMSTLVFTVIAYLMTGQPFELFRMWYFTVICLLVSFVAQSIGLLNGAIFNLQNGVIFGPLFMLPFTIFSGFFVHLHDAHPYLQWLFHISYLKYGLEGAMLSIFGYNREKLECSSTYCHYRYPQKFLDEIDMENANYTYCVIALSGLYVFIRILIYFMLNYRLRHK